MDVAGLLTQASQAAGFRARAGLCQRPPLELGELRRARAREAGTGEAAVLLFDEDRPWPKVLREAVGTSMSSPT